MVYIMIRISNVKLMNTNACHRGTGEIMARLDMANLDTASLITPTARIPKIAPDTKCQSLVSTTIRRGPAMIRTSTLLPFLIGVDNPVFLTISTTDPRVCLQVLADAVVFGIAAVVDGMAAVVDGMAAVVEIIASTTTVVLEDLEVIDRRVWAGVVIIAAGVGMGVEERG